MGKNNNQQPVKQFQRYGIRKFSQGVASVMIASGLFFLGSGAVLANEATPTKPETPATEEKKAEDTVEKIVKPAEAKVETPALDKTELVGYIAEVETKLADGKYANKTEESLQLLQSELAAAKSTVVNATTQAELKAAYSKLVTTVSSKLKNKPVEKKETPAVDTTNGQPTIGKKAENTEKKSDSNSIENTGSHDERNGKEIEEKGSQLRSANEGYTAASTELRKENGEFDGATGKSYKVLDGNNDFKIYVHGYQSDNTDVPAAIVDKQGQVVVLIFLYQKQKLRNLVEKLLYGKGNFVLQEKLMGIQYGVQEVLMSI